MNQQDNNRIIGQVIERGSKAEKGFVFIAEVGSNRGQNVFAHISQFPFEWKGDAFYDVIGRTVSFEIEETPDGRHRATRVQVLDEQEGA